MKADKFLFTNVAQFIFIHFPFIDSFFTKSLYKNILQKVC